MTKKIEVDTAQRCNLQYIESTRCLAYEILHALSICISSHWAQRERYEFHNPSGGVRTRWPDDRTTDDDWHGAQFV